MRKEHIHQSNASAIECGCEKLEPGMRDNSELWLCDWQLMIFYPLTNLVVTAYPVKVGSRKYAEFEHYLTDDFGPDKCGWLFVCEL